MKRIHLIIIALLVSVKVFAQPANDACGGAAAINPNNGCVTGTTVAANDNWVGSIGCQGGGQNPDVWYTFVATNTQLDYNVTTSAPWAGNAEFTLAEATGPCTGLTIRESNCGPSVLSGSVTGIQVGVTYYITISTPSTGTPGPFTLCINNIAAPISPGQDCTNAAVLCNNDPFSQGTFSGVGVVENIALNTCFGGNERQSKWYKFTVACSGTFEFVINPNTNTDDYDWALWNTTTSCYSTANTMGAALACNWSGCPGNTGITSANPCTVLDYDCTGNPNDCSSSQLSTTVVNLTAGQTYSLLIDNYSSSSGGFALTMGGTAVIGPDAAFTYTNPSCGVYNFNKTCDTPNSTFLWTFGDGTTSNLADPSHTYVSTGVYTVVLEVTDALGCVTTSSMTININFPVATATPNPQTICSGSGVGVNLTSTVGGTTFSWIAASNTNVNGESLTAQSGATINNVLTNTTTTAQVVNYTVTPTAAGCVGPTLAVPVTVNPTPSVTNMTSTICSTQSFTATPVNGTNGAVPAGTTYSWGAPVVTGGVTGGSAGSGASITGTLTNPTNTVQTATYTVTPTAAGCPGPTFTVTVTINPAPAITNMTATICSGGSFTSTPANGTNGVVPAGTTYSWGAPVVTGGITGGAAGSGASITGTLTNPTNTAQTATYTVTPTAGGCPGATFTVIVTVNPKPAITNMTATICSGGSFTSTPANGTNGVVPAGTTYSWGAPVVTGGVTGGVAGSGASITGTLTNPTNTAQTATYTVTPTAGGCPGATFTVTVTINPAPAVTNMTATICSGGSFTSTPLNGTNGVVPAGTTYSWGAPVVTGGVTGGAAGSGASITGTLTNPTNTAQTATYTVTPTAAGCPGPTFTVTVTINPAPAITNMTATICSGGSFTSTPANGTNGVVPAGTTYSWGAPVVTGGVTGGAAGSGASITGTLTNPTNTAQTATYTVTPTAGACPGATFTVTVTVNPIPAVTNMTSTICSTQTFTATPVNGTNGVVPAGTTYSWGAPVVTGGVTGGAAGTGASVTGTLTNPTSTPQTATYTVTPTVGGCPGATFTVTVTINPAPAVTNMTATICSGGSFTSTPANGTNGVVPAGTTYSWGAPVVTGGVTGGAAGSGASITGTLTNPTNTAQTATYTVTPTAGACPGATFTVTETINPAPAITNMTATICSGGSFTSTPANGTNGVVPAGTTYSWGAPVVTGGVTGGAAGSGASITGTLTNPTNSVQTATYTVTPTAGACPGATFTITVTINPTPAVTNMTATICSGSSFTSTPANGTNGVVPTGTTYSWGAPVVTGGVTGGAAGSGASVTGTLTNPTTSVQTATYTVTPSVGGCPGATFTVTVTINPSPTAIISGGGVYCSGITPSNVIVTLTGSPIWTVNYTFNGTPMTANSATSSLSLGNTAGTYSLVSVSDALCSGTASGTQTITINPAPTITTTPAPPSTCNGTNGSILVSGTGTGTVSWTGTASGTQTGVTLPYTITSLAAGSYTVTFTDNATGCTSAGTLATINNPGAPILNIINDVVQCGGSYTLPVITGTSLNTPQYYTLPGGPSGGGTVIPVGTVYNAPTNVMIYAYDANGSCTAQEPFAVIINSLPTAVISGGGTYCAGQSISNISVALTGAAGWTVNYTYNGTPLTANGMTSPISLGNAAGTYILTGVTDANCSNTASGTQIITINPVPAVTNMTSTICSGGSFNSTPVDVTNGVVPPGTTYSWGAPVVTGGVTGGVAGSGASITGTLTNPTNLTQTATYTVTPTAGACPGATFTVTVTINPMPAITNMTSTICNTQTFTATPANGTNGVVPAGTSYTWGAPLVTGGVTGGAAGSGASITGTLTNPTNTAQTATYTVTPTAGACPGSTFTVNVTVNPTPAITNMASTICSTQTFTSTPTNGTDGVVPAGTTYSWGAPVVTGGVTGGVAGSGASITGTLTNPTSTAQTATYTVTPTAGTCSGATFTVTVTINPAPAVTNMTAMICSGGSFTSTPLNGMNGVVPAGTTYSWGAPVVTGGVTGGAAGSGASITGTLTNPTNTAQTATYTVTPTAGGCPGATFTVTVTINPSPAVTNMTATICSGGSFTSTPANGTNGVVPVGTTYSWGAPVVTGGVTGGAAGSGASITGTLTNPTSTPQTATYTVTPTAGGCPGATFTVTVTINPAPAVTNMTATICSGGSFTSTPVDGADGVVPAGTTYSWGAPVVTGGVTGGAAGSGASITGTLTNPTNTAQTATYTVTPTAGACPGATFTVTVTINPAPAVNNMTATICNGGSFTSTPVDGTNGVVPTGTTYSWGAPVVTGGVTGGAAGSGASITGTFTNPTNSAQTATYTVTPIAGACPGATFTATVTINPSPAVTNMTATICSGGSFTSTPVDGTNGVVPAGTTYSWGAPVVTGGVTGGAAGSGASITGTLTNPTNTAQTATYTVTPIAGACPGATFTVTVTINPAPAVTNMTATICGGSSFSSTPVDGTNGVVPAGTTYSWGAPVVTGGVTGGAAGSGANITGTLTNPTTTVQTATYTVTPTAGTCPGATFTVTVTVNPSPTAIISGGATYCQGNTVSPIDVAVTGTPNWTIDYTLNGVAQTPITGSTSPLSLGNTPGTYVLTNIADANCSATAGGTQTITVNPLPTFTLSGTDPSLCNLSDGSITISGLNPSTNYTVGYSDDGTAVAVAPFSSDAAGTITITGLNAGDYNNFSVTITSNGCTGTSATTVTLINPGAPVITDLADQTVCDTYTLPAIVVSGAPTSQGYYTATNGGGTQLAVGSAVTSTQTIYIYALNGTCFDEETVTITVNYTPAIAITDPAAACTPATVDLTAAAVTTGSTNLGAMTYWSDATATQALSTPSAVSASGTYYIQSANGACTDIQPVNVVVNATPVLTITNPAPVCTPATVDITVAAVTAGSTNATTLSYWNDAAATSSLATPSAISTSNTYYIQATNAGCTDIAPVVVVVNTTPGAPTAGTDSLYCSSWTLENMTVSGTGGTYTWYSDNALSLVLGTGSTLMPIDVNGTNYYYVTETLNGCEGPASTVTITIQDCEIIVPTAITPNGDGVHDTWEIVDLDDVYPNNVVTVFNRWGNIIYQSTKGNYAGKPWDGTYEGNALPVASYYFVIDFNDEDKGTQTGIVSIVLDK